MHNYFTEEKVKNKQAECACCDFIAVAKENREFLTFYILIIIKV